MAYRTNTTWTEARSRSEIVTQFDRWGHDDWGCIGKYDFPVPANVGGSEASVRFELRGTTVMVTCRSQASYRDNMRCVAFAIEAMRMNEKRGIADTLAKAYLQLNSPTAMRDPYEVLGVRPDASLTVIDATYRALAKERHPDQGGSVEQMKELNDAYERVKSERN